MFAPVASCSTSAARPQAAAFSGRRHSRPAARQCLVVRAATVVPSEVSSKSYLCTGQLCSSQPAALNRNFLDGASLPGLARECRGVWLTVVCNLLEICVGGRATVLARAPDCIISHAAPCVAGSPGSTASTFSISFCMLSCRPSMPDREAGHQTRAKRKPRCSSAAVLKACCMGSAHWLCSLYARRPASAAVRCRCHRCLCCRCCL